MPSEPAKTLGEISNAVALMALAQLQTHITQVKVKVSEDYPKDWGLPIKATPGSACFDIRALVPPDDAPKVVRSNEPQLFRTGLFFEIPEGYVMLVYSRSGHGVKNSIRLGNCTGVIDSDYRGELFISLHMDINSRYSQLEIKHGMRIAQAMIIPVLKTELVLVDTLSETLRGENGGGSTGSH